MTFPRALAVAEVAWTSPAKKDYRHFWERMQVHLAELDKAGWLFRIPEPAGWEEVKANDGMATLLLQPSVAGARIYYTTDGSDPSAYGKTYKGTVAIPVSDNMELKCVVVLPSGRSSGIYTKTIKK
jgi:hexosaminidase